MNNVKRHNDFSRWTLCSITALISLLSLSVLIFIIPGFEAIDWRYFNSLANFTRSSIWHYHTWPLQNPWNSGGLYLLANPQNRLFSPMVLADIFLRSYDANIFSLWFYGWMGCLGMYYLLRELSVDRLFALIGACLFVNCSWFGMHDSVGHIAFGTVRLLPWSLLLFLRIREPLSLPYLAALHAFYIIDGGIYAFLYSILLFLSLILFSASKRADIAQLLRKHKERIVFSVIIFLCLAAPKIVPFLSDFTFLKNNHGTWAITPEWALNALFNPFKFQLTIPGRPTRMGGFYELSCYLGIVTFMLAFAFCIKRWSFVREERLWFYIMLVWFWVASGWGGILQPWTLIDKTPFLNNLHIPSRLFILMFLAYIVVVAKIFEKIFRPLNRWKALVLLVIVIESFVVRNYPFTKITQWERARPLITDNLLAASNVEKTIGWAEPPYSHYGRGTVRTYEPFAPPTKVLAFDNKNYRGEIFAESATLNPRLLSYTPGRIMFDPGGNGAARIILNTNDLGYWKVIAGHASVASGKGELLSLDVVGPDPIILRFIPRYVPFLFLFMALGLILLLWVRRHEQNLKGRGYP